MTSLIDRLYATDVGLRRLHMAIAATVATFATVGVLFWLAAVLQLGSTFVVAGLLVTAVATMGLGMDLEVGHRTLTILLMPVPAAIGLFLGVSVAGNQLSTALVFMALVVATLAASLLGSRGILLALTAIAAFYGSTLIGIPVAAVPAHAGAAVLAAVICAVLLGGLMRERPVAEPARMMRSVRVLASGVAAAALTDQAGTRQALDRFASAVAETRAHIEGHPQCWPTKLKADAGAALGMLEIRIERAAAGVHTAGDEPMRSLLDDLLLQEALLHSSSRRSRSGVGAPEPQIVTGPTVPVEPYPEAADDLPVPTAGRSQVSMAVQLLVAAAFAVTVAMLIDPRRWFWGVLAALVMLFGTSSAADAIGKGGRRLIGTAAALPVGAAAAALTHDRPAALLLCIFVVMFLQQYLADVAYGWSIFFLTVFLYLVFALSGPSAAGVLGTRLLETAAGAAVGVAVALLVLPTRSDALLRGRAHDVLNAVDEAVVRVAMGRSPAAVNQAVRESGQRFRKLQVDAETSRRGWPLSQSHQLITRQLDTAAVVLRELRTMAEQYQDDQVFDAEAVAAVGEVLRAVAHVRVLLGCGEDALDNDLNGHISVPATTSSTATDPNPIIETLRRLQQATEALSRSIAVG